MSGIIFHKCGKRAEKRKLRELLQRISVPFKKSDSVGIKVHWGEKGNTGFLRPDYAKEIVDWLLGFGVKPFIFDTTVLYSGGRRNAADALKTAYEHGYTESFLGCPVIIGDGKDGTDVVDIPSIGKHFNTVNVTSLILKTDGFVIFSHFKGHLESSFGGAIKNISMGFASKAQKQRMHADAYPSLKEGKCNKCGVCIKHCPTGAAQPAKDGYPTYDLEECIGCAQCIGLCPNSALKTMWNIDETIFQERLVETAAAVWKIIGGKTVCINALVKITKECDCMPGENPIIADDIGFVAGYHPVPADKESLRLVGADVFEKAHPNLPWKRQFEFAKEIGFVDE